MKLLGLIFVNLMQCQKKELIENIATLDSKYAPIFVNHHVLPDINLNGHCLINNTYIPKKVVNTYIFLTH